MSIKTAIIFHGTMGSPGGNWFGWLEEQLIKQGMQVWLPELPNAEQPSLREWVDFVRGNCPFAIDEDTLIIGHSSGAILALIVTQENSGPVGAVVAVSVFHDNSLGWEANDRLFDVDFDWSKIRANARQLLFIHSDNDPYVPLGQAQFVANNCQAELILLKNQGHFNLEQSPSYKTFPKLLDTIHTKLSKEEVPIVDEQDGIIGYKERSQVRHEDIYRATGLWITNSKGEILLAQRKFTEEHDPGKWGPAAAGTVTKGESYDSNMIKEMAEELGLQDMVPTKSVKYLLRGKHNFFCQFYTLVVDRPAEDFAFASDELEQVKWFSPGGLAQELVENPDAYLPGLTRLFKGMQKQK